MALTPPDGTTLARSYDSFGRPSGIALGSDYAVHYGYDDLGRFSSVSSSVASVSSVFNYSYVPSSHLIGQVSSFEFQVPYSYEPQRDLKTQVLNQFGTNLISRFDYRNDALGRRTQRVDDASLTNDFSYNTRSELIEALMGTNSFGYQYDPIGNREWARMNANSNNYLANELNQYLSVTSESSVVHLSYDADGNLTNYAGWTFGWDAENRLILAANGTTVVHSVYDYMSRRAEKATGSTTNRFLYDGWNVICEVGRGVPAEPSWTNYYVWGLDLSGTLQGAGGIGGLLMRCSHGAPSPWFYVCDANGNVTELVDTNGAAVARYEYDPYGNVITTEGAQSQSNPFRFSTKYTDDETGLVYYGFRYYSSEMGRWLSRDPIGESGFVSIAYLFLPAHPMIPSALRPDQMVSLARNAFLHHRKSRDIRRQDQTESGSYLFARNDSVNDFDFIGLAPCCGGAPLPSGYGWRCCGDEKNGIAYNDFSRCCAGTSPPELGTYKSVKNCDYGNDDAACLAACPLLPSTDPLTLALCFAWCQTTVCCDH